jgi:hypothetical protein
LGVVLLVFIVFCLWCPTRSLSPFSTDEAADQGGRWLATIKTFQ